MSVECNAHAWEKKCGQRWRKHAKPGETPKMVTIVLYVPLDCDGVLDVRKLKTMLKTCTYLHGVETKERRRIKVRARNLTRSLVPKTPLGTHVIPTSNASNLQELGLGAVAFVRPKSSKRRHASRRTVMRPACSCRARLQSRQQSKARTRTMPVRWMNTVCRRPPSNRTAPVHT